jgi:hypothetical protein
MTIKSQIKDYIDSQPESKRSDMQALHNMVLKTKPASKLWFLDGRDDTGKIVSNPNIGYGSYTIIYANVTTKEFYQIGMSANTTGISDYIMGIEDKKYLAGTYGKIPGKASVTGYCIKFRTLKDLNIDIPKETIQFGFDLQKKAGNINCYNVLNCIVFK